MDPAAAELSSVASVLDDLTRRLATIAERYQAAKRDDLAGDLFTVEGMLSTARRRLDKFVAAAS